MEILLSTTRNPEKHLLRLIERFPILVGLAGQIRAAAHLLTESFNRGNKLLLCGNGGSAADADHWSGELLKGFCSRRALSAEQKSTLPPELAGRLQNALPAIPLTGFSALTTAFSNDVDPNLVYAQLVWALGTPKDVFIGISTSGNAANVCAAAQTAKAKGLKVISLTGEGGGKLATLADIALCVPAKITHQVQELHLPVYHTLCLMIEEDFSGTEMLAE